MRRAHYAGTARGVVLCCAVLIVVTGCSGPRSGISVRSKVDACAAALPLARTAVHRHGTMVRVHALASGELREIAHQLGLPPPPTPTATPTPTPTRATATTATATTPAKSPSTPVLSGTSLPPEPEPHACLVVFRGHYRDTAVDHPIGHPAGRYAIVLVRLHKARLIVVIVADRLPEPLER